MFEDTDFDLAFGGVSVGTCVGAFVFMFGVLLHFNLNGTLLFPNKIKLTNQSGQIKLYVSTELTNQSERSTK